MTGVREVAGKVRRSVMGPRVLVLPRTAASLPEGAHSEHLRFDTARTVVAEAVEEHARLIHRKGSFLDVGGRNGSNRQLAGPLEYWVLDIKPDYEHSMVGDICSCPEIEDESFDVVFSTNTFEHVAEPWLAASEIGRILKPGGLAGTITWFACRYHPVPGDYWRFTHSALELLFEKYGGLETVRSGYDLRYRRDGRNDKQPNHLDRAPVDSFGGWLENWPVFHIGRKPG